MDLIHGGDVVGFELAYGAPPLDFSASLNPLGMPQSVAEAARDAVAAAIPYPDPLCRKLTAALAERLGVSKDMVLCGNGAADIIFRLVLALRPGKALLPVPTFAEYEQALASVGCGCAFHFLDPGRGFQLDRGFVEKITPAVDIVFLCQPNNPTGRAVEPGLLRAILDRCAETGAVLFADECFCSFLENPARHSLLGQIPSHKNLFILGSFTKLFGMAGIRLGYGISGDAALLRKLAAAGPPWSVSTIAQAAGLAALDEADFPGETARLIRAEKERLLARLPALGIDVIGHDANYIFFSSKNHALDACLMRHGILIRNCGNFRGLAPGYFRIAVKLPEENAALLRALATINGTEP